jgi:hypothetical protein
MYTIENHGHFTALFDPQTRKNALAFADRYLKPAQSDSPASTPSKGGASDGQ